MADCMRCGSCCNPVKLSMSPEYIAVRYGLGNNSATSAEDFHFIANHWSCIDRDEDTNAYDYRCDKFNLKTLMCEAYDERPPVCRDFPTYGKDPLDGSQLPRQCSLLRNYPRETWGEGAKPLLPIVSIS